MEIALTMLNIEWRSIGDDSVHDGKEDYEAFFDDVSIGRVYNMPEHPYIDQQWKWFIGWAENPNSGSADSRREAMLAIEERFERWWNVSENRTKHPFG